MRQVTLFRVLSITLVLVSSFLPSCQFGPSKAEMYAREHNLPEQAAVAVSNLNYDENTRKLIDDLSSFPRRSITDTVTLAYLNKVAADSKVDNSELESTAAGYDMAKSGSPEDSVRKGISSVLSDSSGNVIKAYRQLKSMPGVLPQYLNLGLDGYVVEYLDYLSKLPKDFSDYALKNKLCIQDKKLTDLEKKFLADPDRYLNDIYEYELSQISSTDPELAADLKKIPYMQGKDLKIVEAMEDILGLAINSDYKAKLEQIYGKGIVRKMWPVALERVFYKGFDNEFDVSNPMEGSEWYVNSNLANFQAKYNTEMDQPGVDEPKPVILGMNYFHESQGYQPYKSEKEIMYDFALMRWVLGCNSVRLWSYDSDPSKYIEPCQNEGLDVWLQFSPCYSLPDMSLDEYKSRLISFAENAQWRGVRHLIIGNELDLWLKKMGGYNSSNFDGFDARNSGNLKRYINSLVESVRNKFSGDVTYADWGALWGMTTGIDWSSMDTISSNIYFQEGATEDRFFSSVINIKSSSKPLIISEIGSQTFTEANQAGGDYTYAMRFNVHHNPEIQAKIIVKEFKLIYKSGVDGVFIFCWDEPATGQGYDKNKLGFGIWDHVTKEPKTSFWTVYKYYR